ncbi:hypothetical protein NM208_g2821 [Fusarium decemcellulare]|uniref:Uncharacterized protein n=1 Tax=Fusarium decemcellulare TaxID=57161 RepID=A0ACC1SR46_9HYPO|nr:hypothetical protein NM208_g2821 [Fusarium decemcellulare]
MPRGACDSCRQRKIKCDQSSPICSPCRLSGLLCTYCTPRRKRGPKPRSRPTEVTTPREGLGLPTPNDCGPHAFTDFPSNAGSSLGITPEAHVEPGVIANPSPLTICHDNLFSHFAREGFTAEQSVEHCTNLYMQFVFPLLPIICESSFRSEASLELPPFTNEALSPLSTLTPDMIAAIRNYSLTASLCAMIAHLRPCDVYPEHDTIASLFLASSQAMLHPYAGYDISYPTSASLVIRILHASCYQMMGNSSLAWHTMDEAIRLAEQMRLYDENSYDGLDPIEAKLRRNAFWFLFSASRSASVVNGRKHALAEFHLPGLLTTVFCPDDSPPLLDQSRPENKDRFEDNLMCGFQRHHDVWRLGFSLLFDLDLFLATSSRTTGDTKLNDGQKKCLTESYLGFSSVLDDLPSFLQSPAMVCDTDSECEKHQRRAFWIQRANITLSFHHLRMLILDRFLPLKLLGVLGLSDDQLSIDLRKVEIAHEVLVLVSSVPLSALRANGEPLAEKLRYVCATLLEVTQRNESTLILTRAKKHLDALLDYLSKLESRVSDKLTEQYQQLCKIRVAIAGASGVTGSSIANALLDDAGKFEVTALARPASTEKREYVELANRGAIIKPVELKPSSDALVQALAGMDVVISSMTLLSLQEEMTLIEAAHEARVGRYVPSFFGPCCPPRGVMLAREMKEDILDHIKRLYLPYTAIDIGWWYQLALPALPSGKFGIKAEYSTTKIIGDGNMPWAMVFGYSQVHTQNEVWETLERVSGESVPREYETKEELLKTIAEGQAAISKNNLGSAVMLSLGMAQYKYLLGIRGDDTPEHAKYLGYLDVKELYPDVVATPFEKYVEDSFYGRIKTVYS